MNSQTERLTLEGAAGAIEALRDATTVAEGAAPRGVAVIAHPHPLFGGTMDNKVVQTLARAFVVQPQVLLADEPTGSLDFATGEQVMELMFDLNRELGTTLVLVTHDRAIAARCQRRITIDAGRVAADERSA